MSLSFSKSEVVGALFDSWLLFWSFLKDPQSFASALSLYVYEILWLWFILCFICLIFLRFELRLLQLAHHTALYVACFSREMWVFYIVIEDPHFSEKTASRPSLQRESEAQQASFRWAMANLHSSCWGHVGNRTTYPFWQDYEGSTEDGLQKERYFGRNQNSESLVQLNYYYTTRDAGEGHVLDLLANSCTWFEDVSWLHHVFCRCTFMVSFGTIWFSFTPSW